MTTQKITSFDKYWVWFKIDDKKMLFPLNHRMLLKKILNILRLFILLFTINIIVVYTTNATPK